MLNCCTPTAKRMGILGIAQLLVALYLYIYIIYIYIYIFVYTAKKKCMPVNTTPGLVLFYQNQRAIFIFFVTFTFQPS